jgi:hypothetical protein
MKGFKGFPFIIFQVVFTELIKFGMVEKLVDGLEIKLAN